MNALSVGYRFSRQELSTMLQTLRIGGLPGAPLAPVDDKTAQGALKRLSADGIAMVADGTLYIDKLIGFLLRSAAEAGSAVAVTDRARTAVLWRSEKLLILGDFPAEGECALTPLQSEQEALAALTDAVCRMARPLWAQSVFDPGRRFDIPADNPAPEERIARDALALTAPGGPAPPPDDAIFA